MNRPILFSFSFLILVLAGCSREPEWISLFDGESLDGWTPNEHPESWMVEEGAIVTNGPTSHLFYSGEVQKHDFKNFELMLEVKTADHANSGVYVHTEFQETGWPRKGYECQVFSSKRNSDPGKSENKMTGSIYAVRNTWKSPVPDNEWFEYHIIVKGKTIQTILNGQLVCEYTEPETIYRSKDWTGRRFSSGTFALQCHDPGSRVSYRNIRVKPLPDDLATPGKAQEDEEYEKLLIDLAESNFPMVDLHVHLKGGLSLDKAAANARLYGFTYGYAVNCGLGMGLEDNDQVNEYLAGFGLPNNSWHAMQAEGREWQELFSTDVIGKFDYVFTDAMTWTNKDGKRMRLWIPGETEVGDPEDFMDQLVKNIVRILDNEPVQIYVNPTYLPDQISDRYDELWTEDRMDRVIGALVRNQVALEINNRYRIPGPAFIKRAKEAGVRFTFGTNNAGRDDLGRMEYALKMVVECGLAPTNMWLPE